DDGGRFATIEPEVMVNHAETILTREKLVMGENGYVQIEEYGFEDSMTLDEWLAEYN
ncbi:LPD28 domain-containing protein, partial [Bacteroides xylanisolvens]